jgi:hypothetical protein
MLISIALPAAAAFAQCPETAAAADCCRQISRTAVELKYEPDCISVEHRTPVTFTPCRELCVDAPRHKPLATFYPCSTVCPESACHKPVVTAKPCTACATSIELTGCSCQIEWRECEADCAGCS